MCFSHTERERADTAHRGSVGKKESKVMGNC